MPHILSISSEVLDGYVGNSLSRLVFQRAGLEVTAVPTVIFAAHPGHGPSAKMATSPEDLDALIQGLETTGRLTKVNALCTGYFTCAEQVSIAAKWITRLKARAPDTLYLCDPIMGDVSDRGQGLYVPQTVANAIKSELVPLADILCPNTFELEFLVGQKIPDAESAAAAARTLGRKAVLCTSVSAGPDTIATLLVTDGEVWQEETPRLEDVPHGTGDLLAALFLSYHLNGATLAEAHTLAVTYTYGICRKSVGHKDLCLV